MPSPIAKENAELKEKVHQYELLHSSVQSVFNREDGPQ